MLKRISKILVFATLVVAVLVSCESEVKEPEVKQLAKIEVSLDVSMEKKLVSDHDREISYFSIDSKIISATQKEFAVVGEFTGLKVAKGEGTAPTGIALGLHTQGLWQFTVCGCNKEGGIVYKGSTQAYISEAESNKITVALSEYNQGTGTVRLEFLSMTLIEPRLVIEYQRPNETSWTTLLDSQSSLKRNFASENLGNGYTRYTASDIPLPTGSYKLSVKLYNDDEIFSGELFDTFIFENEETLLSGEFAISGSASFAVADPGQTLKFTDAASQIRIKENEIVTGFHALGSVGEVVFPYTNNTSEVVYLIPITAKQDSVFSGTTTITGSANLKYVAFSSGFTGSPVVIGDGVFSGSNLEAIYAPDVTTIGSSAFKGTKIWDIIMQPLRSIGSEAFKDSELPQAPTMHPGVVVGNSAFAGSNIGSIEIPISATLGAGVFENCKNLLKASLEIMEIPSSTFKGCTALIDVNLTNTTIIGESAFEECSALTTLDLPNTVTKIKTQAFKNCSSLDGTLHIYGAIGTDGGDRHTKITDKNAIGENAFLGTTSLDDIFIDRINGDLSGEKWGATCTVTYWAYKLHFNANQGAKDGDDDVVEFPQITQRNGVSISPIDDPKYRLISYNAQYGMTLDGYPFPIPTRSGYGFIGWYDKADILTATRITERTVNTLRANQTLYAQWQKGIVTVIFNAGKDIYDNIATATETYRPVRYLENYGRIAAEDAENDVITSLPTSSIAGRDFVGWYFVDEPKATLSGVSYFDENSQSKLTPVVDSTIVETKKGHVLYAHFKSHLYTVTFNSNLPKDSNVKRNGTAVTSIATIPSRIVKFGFTYKTTWKNLVEQATSSYKGTDSALPNLNLDTWKLDHHYFTGWYYDAGATSQKVTDSTKIPAQSANKATIALYARWTGKDKTVTFKSVEDIPQTLYASATSSTRTIDTYTVRYLKTYGNSVMTSDVMNDFADYSRTLPTTTRTGYTFSGWYKTVAGAKAKTVSLKVEDSTTVTEPTNEELYAAWTPNTYTVTFDPQGGTTPTTSKTVTYHSQYGTLPTPTRTGYKFVGWFQSNVRSEGYGYSGAETKADTYVHTASNHTLYAAWVSYEITVNQSTTTANMAPTNLNSMATISYSGRETKYSINPQTTGYYKDSANSTTNPTMTFVYNAVQIPTTKGTRSSSGVWSDNGSDAVTDFVIECVELAKGGTNGSSSSSMTYTNSTVSITPAKPGYRTFGVYDKNYYGSSKTNDSSALYAKRSKITYTCTGDSTGFSINGADKLNIRDVSLYGITYANTTTHESQRGVTWSISTKLDSKYDSIMASGLLTVGYEIGTMTIKATSSKTLPSGVSTAVTKNITISAPAGLVSVTKGSSLSFTTAAENSNSSKAIPSGQVITNFRPYERTNDQSNVTFTYTNSTDHKVWLEPIYEAESATGSGSTLVYCAFSPSRTTLDNNTLYNATSLKACWMPNTIKSLGTGVFYNCTNLTDFKVSTNLASAGENSFYKVPNHWYEYSGNPSTDLMAFRWAEAYNTVYSLMSATTDGKGVEVSGNVNGTTITRLWKSGSLGEITISDASSTGGYDKSLSKTIYFPYMLNAFKVTYAGRPNYHKRGPFGRTTHHYGSYSWSAKELTSGSFNLNNDKTSYTSGSAFFSSSDGRFVKFSFGAETTNCTLNRDAHHTGGITLYIQLSDYFQNNTLYYRRANYTDVFPSTGVGTTNPNITGSVTLNLPMTAGACWPSQVTQYYKTASYAMKAISSQMTATTHVVQGGEVSFTSVDTGSALTITPTSLAITSGTNMQVSDSSTSVIFTAETLYVNGTSVNPYIRDLVIQVGYW